MFGALALVVAVLAGLTYLALADMTPAFFERQGRRMIRQEVVVAAAVMFALAAVLFRLMNVQARSQFVRWYALGLGLIAVGLIGCGHGTVAWAARRRGRGVRPITSAGSTSSMGPGGRVREGRAWELPLAPLIEMRERYRRLVEVCPDAILVHADGRCVFANPAAARLFGAASPQDLLGRPVLDLIHPDYRDISAERIRQVNTEDRPAPLRQLKVLRLDGQAVDVEITGSRVEFGGRMAIQAVMRDVSDRVRAEEALRSSERRFKATFENAAVGIAHVDLEGRYIWVNQKYCGIMGYSAEELHRMTFQDLTDPADLQRSLDHANRLLSGDEPSYAMEKRCRRRDGSLIWVNLNASLQRDADGEPDHFIAVIQDISERRAAQEALRPEPPGAGGPQRVPGTARPPSAPPRCSAWPTSSAPWPRG